MNDDLILDRAIDRMESFENPGAPDAEWGAEAVRRLNAHIMQEGAIIALGLDRTMTPEDLEHWRVANFAPFIRAAAKPAGSA